VQTFFVVSKRTREGANTSKARFAEANRECYSRSTTQIKRHQTGVAGGELSKERSATKRSHREVTDVLSWAPYRIEVLQRLEQTFFVVA